MSLSSLMFSSRWLSRETSIICLPYPLVSFPPLFILPSRPRPHQVAGMALAPVAMCLMLYALIMYRVRSGRILRRDTTRYGRRSSSRNPEVTVHLFKVCPSAIVLNMMT